METNIKVMSQFIDAGQKYLLENGWQKFGPDWKVPEHCRAYGDNNPYLFFWEAVNLQYSVDAANLRK